MGMFDWFAGHLQCEQCGAISPADASTNIQTSIAIYPAHKVFRVGDWMDIEFDNIDYLGYFCLNRPKDLRTFSIMEQWECPSCLWPHNWVLVEIIDLTISSMKSIVMEKNWGTYVNYITDVCTCYGWEVRDGELRHREET